MANMNDFCTELEFSCRISFLFFRKDVLKSPRSWPDFESKNEEVLLPWQQEPPQTLHFCACISATRTLFPQNIKQIIDEIPHPLFSHNYNMIFSDNGS